MKKLLFLFAGMCLISSLFAQGTIRGKITDAESGEALAGVNILLDRDIPGTATNSKGEYVFENLEDGQLRIIASYVGYEKVIKTVYITSDFININIKMFRTVVEADEVVVTATKSEQTVSNIPGRVELISPRRISASSAQSVDELFESTAGVNVDRSTGVLDRPVIGIRGITGAEQGRVLALIDGVPINKTDGGTINWNRININDIERIEIFKGPGSSIYGNNAMGGVVNMITNRRITNGFSGNASFSYADFNTHKESAFVSGNLGDTTGIYFNASVLNRRSDGYIETREEWRDEYTVKTFMEELSLSGKIGYNFSPHSLVEAEYNYYDDKRSSGIKIQAEDGAYFTHKTDFMKGKYKTVLYGFNIDVNAYYQAEKYLRVSESIKNGNYQRFDVDADRTDMGALINVSYPLGNHNITVGGEIKIGKIKGADVYKTSSDIVQNKGDMNSVAGYIQDEWTVSDELRVIAGVRFDQVLFTDGEFDLINPTGVTDFMEKFEGKLVEYDWKSFTPKFAIQYKAVSNLSMYASYSQGFRAATLDDLTRSGFINSGFKEANPELDPETVDNIEFGLNYDYKKKIFILPSFYFMMGKDFLYYLDTGDSIFGGKKKIVKKDNITEVNIFGADLDIKCFISPKLTVFANYTYTNSEIKKFEENKDLEGKKLTYTPEHMANLGITYLNDFFNTSVSVNYKDEQFTSDDNSTVVFDKDTNKEYSSLIESHATVDLKFWKRVFDHINFSVSIQNVFDNKFVKYYDRISLGRFIVGEIGFNL